MFKSVGSNVQNEAEKRRGGRARLRPFGIQYLDDALMGIADDDLVLIGAPSGIGKTQLCCNIALKNLEAGKRVHFMALEASEFEIERRLKYQLVAQQFFTDSGRPYLRDRLSFDRWLMGDYMEELHAYELIANDFMAKAYDKLFVYYKESEFNVSHMTENILSEASRSDLFIVDHAHFFDFEDENENRAMKRMAKTLRDLVLEQGVPVVLVAHLRKRDRHNAELVPGIDEFHGTSDLTKIATRVITLAGGNRTSDGCYETFFRVPKNRLNGGTNRFVGRTFFDPKRNTYEPSYKIGLASLTRDDGFQELDSSLWPDWARRFS